MTAGKTIALTIHTFVGKVIYLHFNTLSNFVIAFLWDWNEYYVFQYTTECIKRKRHHFADKGLYSQSYGFSNSHVWM